MALKQDQKVVGTLRKLCSKIFSGWKNHYELCKKGNSDIYSMDIETKLVEKLTEHSTIDTSPSYSRWQIYLFNSDRSGLQQLYVKEVRNKVKR